MEKKHTSSGMATAIPPKPTNRGQLRKIPRPRNAFMIFANEHRRQFQAMFPTDTNNQISTRLGDAWHNMPKERKADYFTRARAEDQEHKRKYPFYHYTPSLSKHFKQEMKRVKYINRIRLLSPSSSADSLTTSVKPQQAVMRVALLNCSEAGGATSSASTSAISTSATAPPATRPPPPPLPSVASHTHPVLQHTIQTAPMFGRPLIQQPLWVASSPFVHTLVPQPLHTTKILFPSQSYFGPEVDGTMMAQQRLCEYHLNAQAASEQQRYNPQQKVEPSLDAHLLVPETLSQAVLEHITPVVQPRSSPVAGVAHKSHSGDDHYGGGVEAKIAAMAPAAPDCYKPPPHMIIPMPTGDSKPIGFDYCGSAGLYPYVVQTTSDPWQAERRKFDTFMAAQQMTAIPTNIVHVSDDETVCAASALMALTTRYNGQYPMESSRDFNGAMMQTAPKLAVYSPTAVSSSYQYNRATVRPPIVGLPPIESVLFPTKSSRTRRDNCSTSTIGGSDSATAACRSRPSSPSTSQCISGAFRLLLGDETADEDRLRYSTDSPRSGASLHRDSSSSSSSEASRSEPELTHSATDVRSQQQDTSPTSTDDDVTSSDIHAAAHDTSSKSGETTPRGTDPAGDRPTTPPYREDDHCNNHQRDHGARPSTAFFPLGDLTGREYDKKTGCPSVIFLPCKASFAADLGWEPYLLPTPEEMVTHHQQSAPLAVDHVDDHRTKTCTSAVQCS